jgi:hypothetical protein
VLDMPGEQSCRGVCVMRQYGVKNGAVLARDVLSVEALRHRPAPVELRRVAQRYRSTQKNRIRAAGQQGEVERAVRYGPLVTQPTGISRHHLGSAIEPVMRGEHL